MDDRITNVFVNPVDSIIKLNLWEVEMLIIKERTTAEILEDKESCRCCGCDTDQYVENCEKQGDKYLCYTTCFPRFKLELPPLYQK